MVSYTRVIIKIYGPIVVNYGKPKGYMRNILYCPSLLVGALLIWFSVIFNQISSLMILVLHYSCFYLAWTKVQHEYGTYFKHIHAFIEVIYSYCSINLYFQEAWMNCEQFWNIRYMLILQKCASLYLVCFLLFLWKVFTFLLFLYKLSWYFLWAHCFIAYSSLCRMLMLSWFHCLLDTSIQVQNVLSPGPWRIIIIDP